MEYRIGQTATHPDGRKVQWDGSNWVNAGAPARRDLSSKLATPEQKTIADLRVAAQNIAGARKQAEEFGKLNRDVGTGGILGIPGASEVRSLFNPKVATMQGLSNAMIPGMHVTPGPMTDADAKLYKSAIPNPNLPGSTNAALTKDIGRKEQEAAARIAFFERWAANTGSLNGAEAAFNDFWTKREASKAKTKPAPPPATRVKPPQRGGSTGATYLGPE